MFSYHPIDTPFGNFGAFGDVVSIWQQKCSGERLPAWQDFSVADFHGWQTYMARSEANKARNDLRFKFFGDGAVALQGEDFTGSSFAEALPIAYERIYKAHIEQMLAGAVIATAKTPAAGNTVKQYFLQILHLPLASDGGTVDQVLHLLRRYEETEV